MALRLQTRIGLGFATAVATLLVALALMIGAFAVARAENYRVNGYMLPGLRASQAMDVAFVRMTRAEQTLLYKPDRAASAEANQANARRDFLAQYALAGHTADAPEETALYAAIGRNFNRCLDAQSRVKALVDAGRVDAARSLSERTVIPLFNVVETDIERFSSLQGARIDDAWSALFAGFDRVEAFLLAVSLAGMIGAGALWRQAVRTIARPLLALERSAEALEAGRVEVPDGVEAARTVELDRLRSRFIRMSRRLDESARRLRDANAHLESQVATRTAELSTANERLEQLVAELRTLNQLKGDFLAVMSHELLTPINFIVGFGSALEDELLGPLNDPQHQTLDKMMKGAERLTRMVRNTLEYTQLASGTLPFASRPIDYADVVDDAIAQVTERLAERGQTLELARPPGRVPAHADPERASQVLVELLDNASKFSPAGAKLSLRVEADDAGVTTTIADPGAGIPTASLPHLFTPFFQVDLTRTRAHGGMGLGLAIAQHLVVRMGGMLLLASHPGLGTTVRFTLPSSARVARVEGPSSAEA